MAENNALPKFESVEDLSDYFDTPDMGEHWAGLPDADFTVNLQKRVIWFP